MLHFRQWGKAARDGGGTSNHGGGRLARRWNAAAVGEVRRAFSKGETTRRQREEEKLSAGAARFHSSSPVYGSGDSLRMISSGSVVQRMEEALFQFPDFGQSLGSSPRFQFQDLPGETDQGHLRVSVRQINHDVLLAQI